MDLLHSRSHFGFIGLGLIGGSVARCIRRELPDARISAYNYYETKKHPRLEKALADGVLTDITTDISRVSDWDVIFPHKCGISYQIKAISESELYPDRCGKREGRDLRCDP